MKTQTRTINKSRQRDAIVNYIMTYQNHPTADTIYNAIKEDFPNISLGTVYRNLTLLTELGTIKKLSCGGSSEHFDGDTTPHNHFICNCCGNITDLKMDNIDFLNELASKNFDGEISGHNIYFYGLCCACKTQQSK